MAGDELTCSGEFVAVARRDYGTGVEAALACTRETDGVAVIGTAAFRL